MMRGEVAAPEDDTQSCKKSIGFGLASPGWGGLARLQICQFSETIRHRWYKKGSKYW